MIVGFILIIVGVVFLLQNLGYLPEEARGIIWPVILIVIGVSILVKRRNGGFLLARQNFYWPFWCPKKRKITRKGK